VSYQFSARIVSARAIAWLREAPQERANLCCARELHWDEAAHYRAWEEGVPPEHLDGFRAKAARLAEAKAAARQQAWEALARAGLDESDLRATVTLDGWGYFNIVGHFPAIARLLGEAPAEHAIRAPRSLSLWLARVFLSAPRHELQAMRLAGQPGRELGPALEAAERITLRELAEGMQTFVTQDRGEPSREPVEPAPTQGPYRELPGSTEEEELEIPWRSLLALAKRAHDEDAWYLSWSS